MHRYLFIAIITASLSKPQKFADLLTFGNPYVLCEDAGGRKTSGYLVSVSGRWVKLYRYGAGYVVLWDPTCRVFDERDCLR